MSKAVVFTLGCKVNDVESASLAHGLKELGYEVSDKLGYADLYILNTCAVTSEAEKKSRQLLARAYKYNPQAKIIVCGCAAQKNASAFSGKKGVTLVTGARQKSKILSLLDKEGTSIDDFDGAYDDLPLPESLKTRHFIKIQDGCNNFCSYCIVPYLRGRSRSRALREVLLEAQTSKAEELVLTGIDISSYNDQGNRLTQLLKALSPLEKRIRLGSLEVRVIDEELLQTARGMPGFAPHFHLSLQSGSSAVLKRMSRKYTGEQYLEKCKLIYRYFPDAAITTDVIVGFPGESEEEFAESISLIKQVGFAQIHCFVYSPREGTVAAKLPQLSLTVKEERKARLLALEKELRDSYINKFIGKTLTFVPETYQDGRTLGYSENYIRIAVEGKVERACKVKLIKKQSSDLCMGVIDYE